MGEVGETGASRRQTIIILKEMQNITFIHNKDEISTQMGAGNEW